MRNKRTSASPSQRSTWGLLLKKLVKRLGVAWENRPCLVIAEVHGCREISLNLHLLQWAVQLFTWRNNKSVAHLFSRRSQNQQIAHLPCSLLSEECLPLVFIIGVFSGYTSLCSVERQAGKLQLLLSPKDCLIIVLWHIGRSLFVPDIGFHIPRASIPCTLLDTGLERFQQMLTRRIQDWRLPRSRVPTYCTGH